MRLVGRVWRGWFPAALLVLLLVMPFGEFELPVQHSHHGGNAFVKSETPLRVPAHPHFTAESADWTAVAVQRAGNDWCPRTTAHCAIVQVVEVPAVSDSFPGFASVRGPPGRALSGYGRDTLLHCCIDRR
ncbi:MULTISPECIES: putative copper homeostasis (lipo)protein LpqS [Nocardia]|uniref:hypothetical protein n=1 Tax=Nocardia TaxID=1817 RepID=UPI0019BCBE3B|nr:hypothetical protein [Nocardia sp.]